MNDISLPFAEYTTSVTLGEKVTVDFRGVTFVKREKDGNASISSFGYVVAKYEDVLNDWLRARGVR